MSANTISIEEIRRALDAGKALNILDVRTRPEYDRAHASGARLMPLDELDIPSITTWRGSEPLYVICHSGARAAKACQRLSESGMSDVYSIEGGTDAWKKAGLPVQLGQSKVISLERQVRIGAGSIVALGTALAWRIHPAFLLLPAFVGTGLVFAGITDYCGMGMLLAKCPWNR